MLWYGSERSLLFFSPSSPLSESRKCCLCFPQDKSHLGLTCACVCMKVITNIYIYTYSISGKLHLGDVSLCVGVSVNLSDKVCIHLYNYVMSAICVCVCARQ